MPTPSRSSSRTSSATSSLHSTRSGSAGSRPVRSTGSSRSASGASGRALSSASLHNSRSATPSFSSGSRASASSSRQLWSTANMNRLMASMPMRAIPMSKLEKLEAVSEIFRSRYSTPAKLAKAEKQLHVLFPRLKHMSDQAVVAFIARAREIYHDKLVQQTQIGRQNVQSLDMHKMFGSRLTAANFGHAAASPRRASPPKRSAVRGSMF